MTHRIGKFELRHVLGGGASSTVYLALDFLNEAALRCGRDKRSTAKMNAK